MRHLLQRVKVRWRRNLVKNGAVLFRHTLNVKQEHDSPVVMHFLDDEEQSEEDEDHDSLLRKIDEQINEHEQAIFHQVMSPDCGDESDFDFDHSIEILNELYRNRLDLLESFPEKSANYSRLPLFNRRGFNRAALPKWLAKPSVDSRADLKELESDLKFALFVEELYHRTDYMCDINPVAEVARLKKLMRNAELDSEWRYTNEDKVDLTEEAIKLQKWIENSTFSEKRIPGRNITRQ